MSLFVEAGLGKGRGASVPGRVGLVFDVLKQRPAIVLHSGQVERSSPAVSLDRGRNGSVAMEILEPFAVLTVGEVGVSVLVKFLVPTFVFVLAGKMMGQEAGVKGLVMGPP